MDLDRYGQDQQYAAKFFGVVYATGMPATYDNHHPTRNLGRIPPSLALPVHVKDMVTPQLCGAGPVALVPSAIDGLDGHLADRLPFYLGQKAMDGIEAQLA